ncbi:MAG: shikimate kinase [Vicinamibacteria bacterium]|nr:shikimate kinase [Vicinamibacteria bacterium]
MKSNLVLIGYRGTGKSTIAALLSKRSRWPVVSLDRLIVETAGLDIPEIVARFGWPRFRELERAEVERSARRERHILDCGGGVVEDPRNVTSLSACGFCVLLTAGVASIAARIGGDSNRPSLSGQSIVLEIEEKLKQRGPLYHAAADLVLATDHATPEEIVNAILRAAPVFSGVDA